MKQVMIAMCLAGLVMPGVAATWDLSTDDTRLTVAVVTNRIYVTSLLNPTQNWEWAAAPSEMPLPGVNSVQMGGTNYTPVWVYCDASEESNTTYTVALRFTNAVPALELKSYWRAYAGPGPVENWMTISNQSGAVVTYSASIAAGVIQVQASGTANLHRADKTAVGQGVVYNNVIGANNNFSLPSTMIPFAVLDVGSSNGLYVGVEWEVGTLYVTSGADPASITVSSYPITEGVAQGAGEVFTVPNVYYGTYKGDLDDGCNRFKRWFWNHKIPRSLHDNPDEPWVQNCFSPYGDAPQSDYDAQAATGVECVKWDYGWYDNRSWNYRPAQWPSGFDFATKAHNAGLKASVYMGGTYNDADLTTTAGRDSQLAALLTRYDQGWFDMWRTDLYTAPKEPMPQTYNGVKNFLYIHDTLIANRPGYRYENCCNGGKYKGFAICRRMTFCTMNDSDKNPVHTRSTYYANSFAINPVQLKSDLGPAETAYYLRTDMLGAILTWVVDNPVYREHIALYKTKQRPILRGANVYHILPMADGVNWDGLEFFNPDLKKGSVFLFKPSTSASDGDAKTIRFKGLDRNLVYRLTFQDRTSLNCVTTGAQLMDAGVTVTGMTGNNASEIIWFEATKVHVVASASPEAGMAPLSVNFSADGVSSEGIPLTYAWTFGDGGTSGTQNPTHTYTNAGHYVAQVTADDGAGNVATGQVAVTAMGGARRMFISFDGYNRSETLTNIPALLVFGTNLAAKGFAYDQVASSNGWDLMFTDAGMTTVLNHEIERWDTNGLSYVWVQVPRLVQGGGIWAYWGSTSMAGAPAPCLTNGSVWSEGFAGVWHMTNGVTLSGADSTANRNNGTVGSGATATSGLIDGGGQFDASINACVNMGTLNPLPAGTGTASIWVNWNVTSGNGWAMAKGADFSSGNSWGIVVLPGASQCDIAPFYNASGGAYGPAATITSGTGVWHHVAMVMRSGAQDLYVDGVWRVTQTRATLTWPANQFNIGKTDRASPYHYGFFGALDEARVATAQRSADWVWAEYQTVASNMTFATYGTVSLVGDSNLAPTVATPAQANPSPVTNTTTELTALGADDVGESVLKYTWSTTGTPPASVSFVPNGDNAAKSSTATFSKTGSYDLQVVIRDPYGATATSSVAVVVNQTLTGISVVPASTTVTTNLTRQFAATALDQFGYAMGAQPGFTWDVAGGGTINASGLFTAGAVAGGPYTVTADTAGKTGIATVVVSDLPPAVPTKMLVRFAVYTNRTEVLTNFPVLVVFSNNVGGSGFNYGNFLSPGGYDLRFVTNLADTTSLNYEIESWNTNAGQASHVWVQVPTIPSDGSGYIWAKWGDPAHSNQLPCTTNGAVWGNGYVGVWHLTNGVTLSGADATANRNNGTVGSGATAIDGIIDGGGAFHGTFNDYVGLGTLNPLPGGTGTASVWVKWNSESKAKNNYVLGKGDDNGTVSWGLGLIPSDSSCNYLLLYGNAQWVGPATIASAPGSWHLVTAVMRPNVQELYVDGVLGATGTKATITPAAGAGFFIGKTARADPYAYPANGALDEVRVATAQRSADWVWAEWVNVASNTAFARFGETTQSGTAYEQWQLEHFTSAQMVDETISGTLADPDGDGAKNEHEFGARTDPLDPASFLRITSAGAGGSDGFVVRWHSVSNVVYRLERATNLVDGFTNRVVHGITATPSENVYTDTAPTEASSHFYRVGVE